MRTFLIIICCITTILTNSYAKTIDLDIVLKQYYINHEYDKCYKLSKVIDKKQYSYYTLSPFGIKYKDGNNYVSVLAKEYEFKSSFQGNRDLFYSSFMNRTDEVQKYVDRKEFYPQFVSWIDSVNKIPVPNQFDLVLEQNKKSNQISEITAEINRVNKLNKIYSFLKYTDTVALHSIFDIDNKRMINIVKSRSVKNLLDLYSQEFDLNTGKVYITGMEDQIQIDIRNYMDSVVASNRFINKDQIAHFLYNNTGFTKAEKVFVTYYFLKSFLSYATKENTSYTSYKDIDKIVLYKNTVCDGYSTFFKYLLNSAGVECYHIALKANGGGHANNIVVLDGKPYYTDLTWDVWCKQIGTFKKSTVRNEFSLTINPYDYSGINDYSYIKQVNGTDDTVGFINYIKALK